MKSSDSRESRGVEPGDKFRQVWPPTGATLVVESVIDSENVAVQRANGARQVFPVSSLLNPEWWVRDDA